MDSSILAQLLYAVKSKSYKSEIWKEIDISIQYPDDLQIQEAGYNCLHLSVMKEDFDLTKKLLYKGADLIKQGSRNGYTPLHLFVKSKLCNESKKFHELIGTLREQRIIDVLLYEQIKRDNARNPKCFFGMSHLHIACMVNNLHAVKFFLKAGESVDQAISANSSFFAGWTPLHIAVTYSSIETINSLFDYGADIHLKDASSQSSLHRLLKRQLDAMNVITMGKREIVTSIFCEVKRLEMIICALLKGINTKGVNFVDEAGISALHVACTLTTPYMVEDLLKRNVDINKPLNNNLICWAGWTPLHFAACCSKETVKLLVQNGADITIMNRKGETPLDFCVKRYSPSVIHSILSTKDEFSEIVLSNQSTKLMDLIFIMDDCDLFNKFLEKLPDRNVTVPRDSPIWPGYSIFHLAISMHERTLDPKDYISQLFNPETLPEQYTCLEIEEKTYWKRIVVCLVRQCSLTTKDANGWTPIHLGFKLLKTNVVDTLLNRCLTNETDQDGLSFLHMACAVGKKNIVERFINDMEIPVKKYFKWHREKCLLTAQANSTALHVAVAFDHCEIVEFLLEKKANVYAQDVLGSTPIHLSAFSQPMARLLFSKIKNLKEVVNRDGMSHLHVAAFVDDGTAIKKLLKGGANVNVMSRNNIPLSKIDYLEQTPLHIAVKMANLKAVQVLIEADADIHATRSCSKYDTPLQGAMRITPNEITEEFVKKLYCEKQMKGPMEAYGVTLLHVACAAFDLKWTEKLLKQGADPNAQACMDENYVCEWKGCSPLHLLLCRFEFATSKLKTFRAIIELLLKYGADVTLQNELGESPVLLAEKIVLEQMCDEDSKKEEEGEAESKSKNGRFKGEKKRNEKIVKEENNGLKDESKLNMYSIADLLLKHQKSYAINPTNSRGSSHFHYACKRNKARIVEKFIENGVDVNQADDIFEMTEYAGNTPLHFALLYRSFEVAKVLLEHNADVKAKNFLRNTPLHMAAVANVDNMDLLETMLRMGADIKAKNVRNETPLDLLVQADFISSDELKFYFSHGCLIEFKVKEAYKGIIGRLLRNSIPDNREAILRLLFECCNLSEQIKNGFNAIQSLVSSPPGPVNWTVDRYLEGIQFFIDIGCDIDRQTCFGLTACHSACYYDNVQAVEALLLLGASINVTCKKSKSPFSSSDSSAKLSNASLLQNYRTCTIVGIHIWKMKYMGLQVNESAMEIAEEFWNAGNMDIKLEDHCKDELDKMAQMKISEKWTMRDFLSESKIVIEYQTLSLSQRQSIDKIFQSHADLRKMFPKFCGLLMYHYRKARSYVEPYWAIKTAMATMFRLELSDECFMWMFECFEIWNLLKSLNLHERASEEL